MLGTHDITIVLLDLGILLGLSRFLGEVARRYRQPMVVGEIAAGILLGPTVLGTLAPELQQILFPIRANTLIALEGLTTIAVVLLLLVAGIEINLSSLWKQGRTALLVSTLGILFPFLLGFAASHTWPHFLGFDGGTDILTFSLFFGTALSISALPVIAKTLMDMNLLKSDMGILVIASAAFNDLIGWIIFSVVLSLIGAGAVYGRNPQQTVILTIIFTVFTLTVLRWAFHKILPWLEKKTVWPGGILGFVFAFTMIGAAATQWLGVHAVFGAFIVGTAIGDSKHLTERTKDVITQFAMNIFAPLFFAFIGLRINFAANFNFPLIIIVFLLACTGKILGCSLGARWGGIAGKESLAIGFGMNARGAMEIILGLLALEFGVIHEQLFVALVIMAIGTTMLSGPVMEWLIREKKPLKLMHLIKPAGFVESLSYKNRSDVIMELAYRAADETGLDSAMIYKAVWDREQIMGTALGAGIAVPHARLLEITAPVVVVGRSEEGVDFNAIDGAPAKLIVFILTPTRDQGAQLQILADVARVFSHPEARNEAFKAQNYDSFIDALKTVPDKET
ncbi:MAG: cation:proton antiporter [Candidatus Latescibacteria bacterium]|nr:cation:proton antiporter [Candidatus Latescibacterota bacterium]